RRYAEATDSFRRGLALIDDVPFQGTSRRRMSAGLELAERVRAVGELHQFCERVRPLHGVELLPAAQARLVLEHCRQFWHEREEIYRRLSQMPDPKLRQQVRSDLLDLAILSAHLQVRLSPAAQSAAARRSALAVLDQAEEMFGPSCVLYEERRAQAEALGLA